MPKQPTPVQRLMAAMDRCAIARGEAQWTNGYRAAVGGGAMQDAENRRLYAKEQRQWERVEAAHAAFRRLAQRLLREAAKPAPRRRSRSRTGGDKT